MKIGIDVSQLAYPGTGVARYTELLVRSLIQNDTSHEYVLFFSSLRKEFPEALQEQLPANFSLKKFRFPPTILDIIWNELHLYPVENLIGDVDIFFSSDWTEPPVRSAKKITTIHDLSIYKFPETSHSQIVKTQKRRLRRVQKESDAILCDSYATKNDVRELLTIDEDKLHVVYPPVLTHEPSENTMAQTMKKYHAEKPFVLSVGKLEPRKNLSRLIDAFLMVDPKDVELLIVGPEGWDTTINRQKSEKVRFLGYVSDDELFALYRSALFFVYPSLYEGFGYPVVEAMNLGCPVATSQTSSLGEIVDDSGLLFDPLATDDIAKTLEVLIKDSSLRKTLSIRGKQKAQKFTMATFYLSLLRIFQSLQ